MPEILMLTVGSACMKSGKWQVQANIALITIGKYIQTNIESK